MSEQDPQTPATSAAMSKPLWRRPLGILLILSLTVNAFVLTAAAGRYLVGPGPEARRGGPAAVLRPFLRHAPPDVQALVEELQEERRAGFRARHAERQEAFQALQAAMRAEPFDPAAVADAQARLRAIRNERRTAVDAVLLELMGAIQADQRAQLADRYERVFGRRRGPRE